MTVPRDWVTVSNFDNWNCFEEDIFNTIKYPFPTNSATFIKIKIYFPLSTWQEQDSLCLKNKDAHDFLMQPH